VKKKAGSDETPSPTASAIPGQFSVNSFVE
jgi:hypothetical protein